MKVKICSILILLMIIPLVHAVSYDDKNMLTSTVVIHNSFKINPTTSSYEIKFVNASVSSFPRNDFRQNVLSISTNPDASIGENIVFSFVHPSTELYDITVTSNVTTINTIDEIKDTVVFPVNNLDSSFYQYVAPAEIIDVNPEIKNLASELIGDNTDLYSIEYSFAEYVRKNVAYDLGTLTANVDQKSSWVLENKKGVCDEITNLFISLNRAAGIPTRFVSGVAYTNLDDVFGKNWVPHAWAEVYFPGYGWIPYDVTYGQYGFIDAGHIKLLDSNDSSSSNVNYNYLGRNIVLKPGVLDIDVNVSDYGDNARGRYSFDASLNTNEVGFGSYDLVAVNVQNTHDYYQVADLYLASTQDIDIIEESRETVLNKTIHRKQVLLKPRQSSTVYWLIHVKKDLDPGFIYTFPITVYNTYNETSNVNLASRRDYAVIDEEHLKSLMISQSEEVSKPYSKNIYLQCSADKDAMYLEDSVSVQCVLDNQGDKSFDNVNICVDGNCTSRSLALQKVPFGFIKKFLSEGLKSIEVKVYNDDFTKVSYVPVNVLDKPKIIISDLISPSTARYSDAFDITFTLKKDSKSNPKNIRLMLKSETNNAEWTFEEFDVDKTFTIKSKGSSMGPGKNNYKILVEYYDDKGNKYTSEKDFIIESDSTFFENIVLYLNVIGRSIERTFSG